MSIIALLFGSHCCVLHFYSTWDCGVLFERWICAFSSIRCVSLCTSKEKAFYHCQKILLFYHLQNMFMRIWVKKGVITKFECSRWFSMHYYKINDRIRIDVSIKSGRNVAQILIKQDANGFITIKGKTLFLWHLWAFRNGAC